MVISKQFSVVIPFQVCTQYIELNEHHGNSTLDLNILSFRPYSWMKLLTEDKTANLAFQNMDYEVMASLKESGSTTLVLNIKMKRKITKGITQIIAPPGILVAVSWVSLL